MVDQRLAEQCPDERVMDAVALVESDSTAALSMFPRLCAEFPSDPRLRFLFGSVLAGAGEYAQARSEMMEALRISPSYAIARFQLGLLELTSGEPHAAEATWRLLDDLPADDPLRVMAGGLKSLARDQFSDAVRQLEHGITLNTQFPALNLDMRLLINEIAAVAARGAEPPQETSAAHLLLQQYKTKPTRH